jgi:hypothetical protein
MWRYLFVLADEACAPLTASSQRSDRSSWSETRRSITWRGVAGDGCAVPGAERSDRIYGGWHAAMTGNCALLTPPSSLAGCSVRQPGIVYLRWRRCSLVIIKMHHSIEVF